MNKLSADRIASVRLDDASIIRRTPEIEHERRVAIYDLIEANELRPLAGLGAHLVGPFDLFISVREQRLTLQLTGANGERGDVTLPLAPFRTTIKDYFLMCESYYDAIKTAPSDRIQTLDMARRAVHNEGSEQLQARLADALEMDFPTARRLFTLICVLHIK